MLNYKDKEIFIFDIDSTIADSYGPVHEKNAEIICNLLKLGKIVVFATDRGKDLIEEKVVNLLPCGRKYFTQIHLQPAGGAAMYSWKEAQWEEIYADRIDNKYELQIINSYTSALADADPSLKDNKPFILNKDQLMLSISALPPDTTKEKRLSWDPDHKKRNKIVTIMQEALPDLKIHIGGSATINIAMPHVSKAYGVNKLFDILRLDKNKALFVGDGIFPGGNDYCMLETGIETLKVENPEDTVNKLQMSLN